VKRTDDLLTRAIINNVTYIPQTVPTLYTALSAGADVMNPIVYGVNSNAFVLKYGEVVEIVLINNDGGDHPWQYAECQLSLCGISLTLVQHAWTQFPNHRPFSPKHSLRFKGPCSPKYPYPP
jgi:hypothetical protein